MHRNGLYVWSVSYPPTPIARATLARFNEREDYTFPTDLPVDAVAAMHGFDWLDASWVEAQLVAPTADLSAAELLSVALALAFDDLARATALLRRYEDDRDPAVRTALVNAALDYNWEWFLEGRACIEQDPELLAAVGAALATGIAPRPVNEMGEPLDVFGRADAADEDEDEEDGGDA